MAKLSARGQKELFRLSRTVPIEEGECITFYAFMDSGKIVRKTSYKGAFDRPGKWTVVNWEGKFESQDKVKEILLRTGCVQI
jgi:hypothetical protein